MRHHGLRFITSSVHIKAAEEKAAMEKAIREKAAQDEAAGKENARIKEPEEEAKPPTSEASNTKEDDNAEKGLSSRFSFMKKKAKMTAEPTAYQIVSSPCKVLLADDSDDVCMECKSKLEEAGEVTAGATLPTAAGIEETKQSEVQPVRSCPCEWFICDDDLSNIRNFVIQVCRTLLSSQVSHSFSYFFLFACTMYLSVINRTS